MERAQVEAPSSSKTLFSFSRRRSPLKSGTFCTLVRILSHCYDESRGPHTAEAVTQELNPGYGGDEVGQAVGKEVCERGELVGPDKTECPSLATMKGKVSDESCEAHGAEDERSSDAQHLEIDEIERMMGIEESEDLFKQLDVTFDESAEGIGLQDKRRCEEKLLVDELEHILRGDGKHVHENGIDPLTTSMDENYVAVTNKQAEDLDGQELGTAKDDNAQKSSEAFDVVLDRNMTGKVLDSRGNGKENSLSFKNSSREECQMQQTDMEIEKSVSSSGAMDFPNPMTNAEIEKIEYSSQKTSEALCVLIDKDKNRDPPAETELEKSSSNHLAEDEDVEEGEISSDCGTDDKSLDMSLVPDKNEVLVSLDTSDKKNFLYDEVNGGNKKGYEFASFEVDTFDKANTSREVQQETSDRKKMTFRPEMVVHEKPATGKKVEADDLLLKDGRKRKKSSGSEEGAVCPPASPNNLDSLGQISQKSSAVSHGISSTGELQQDASSCKKKKRGPLSKEKKAKKKQKERKRRAEKNRELGVKRLKLYPVSKPKTVSYCRHYLKGRCHQGDKCQFSHDTVPLTKSTPCCYFARHSCMKGDDCPFDHDLSKYPCDSYMKGFCSRGAACMFSHKKSSKEDSAAASDNTKPEFKNPSLPGNKKQLNVTGGPLQNINALSDSVGAHPHTTMKTLLKPPALVPKGISHLLTADKSAVVNSTTVKQESSSPHGNVVGKVGNQAIKSASEKLKNMDVTPSRNSPCVVPKGINFLSFGKAPSFSSSSKEVAGLDSNRDIGMQPALANNSNFQKQGSLSPNNAVSIKVGEQTGPTASRTNHILNEMLKKSAPPANPLEMNILSFGKVSVDDSSSNRKVSFPSSCGIDIAGAFQAEPTAAGKSQNSSAVSLRLPSSPFASDQSSASLASVKCEGAPKSAQKALSLIRFAAKYDPKMKTDRPPSALDVGKECTGNTAASSQNNLAKASKVLDFLSSSGSKTKQ